jgi:hypothetical protein
MTRRKRICSSGTASSAACEHGCIELDASDPAHIVAVHEAARALAAERTGAIVTEFWMKRHEDGWEGRVSHAGRPGLTYDDAAELDRLGYLAGPAAEERFAGGRDFDECEDDRSLANLISEKLPTDREAEGDARGRVEGLIADGGTWYVILELARQLLARTEGESVPHDDVANIAVAELGGPAAPGWTLGPRAPECSMS